MPFTWQLCPGSVTETFRFAGTCARHQARKEAFESQQKHVTKCFSIHFSSVVSRFSNNIVPNKILTESDFGQEVIDSPAVCKNNSYHWVALRPTESVHIPNNFSESLLCERRKTAEPGLKEVPLNHCPSSFLKTKLIGVTLVNSITWVPGVQFCDTTSAHRSVRSPPEPSLLRSPCIWPPVPFSSSPPLPLW